MERSALLHIASGIGNIVFATPLLVALSELEFTVDVKLDADYPSACEILQPWSIIRAIRRQVDLGSYSYVIPAIPPFYWPRFARLYKNVQQAVRRPPDSLFYQNEQEFHLSFARELGYPRDRRPYYRLPISASSSEEVSSTTLVIAPGCKTGEMALKRWPFFPQLAERFPDVVIVGTNDDLRDAHNASFRFPAHVRSLVDRLSLRETAECLASAGVVVANDSGLAHVAGAVGAPTVILFGPTPDRTLGQFPENVCVLRAGLPCEPCWFGRRFQACNRRIDCLHEIGVDEVEWVVRRFLGALSPVHIKVTAEN
jgi:ADP-heptose:LPS heptosyltransferase